MAEGRLPTPGDAARSERQQWWRSLTDDEQADLKFHQWLKVADPYAFSVVEEVERQQVREDARRIRAVAEASGLFSGFEGENLDLALARPRPETPWVFEGLQRAGHKATLVAQFKTGKTTFAGNVVRSLADGEPLLGVHKTIALDGNVGVFDYELGRDDMLDLYASMGIGCRDRVVVESLRGTGFTLANPVHREQTIDWLKGHDVQYWVVDPFGRAMRGFGEENSNDDVRAFMMELDFVAREAGLLGVLMTVHTGRAVSEVGEERARGASVLDDDPDVRWILTRKDSVRFFRAEGRSGIQVEEVALDFSPSDQRLVATGRSRHDVAGDKFRVPVEVYVESNPGCSGRDIKANVPGTDKGINAALNALVAEGLVRREKDGTAHRHYPSDGTPPIRRTIVSVDPTEATMRTDADRGDASPEGHTE